jgi:hypothetical protein
MKKNIVSFKKFINEGFDMGEFRGPKNMRNVYNRGGMMGSNPFPKTFIDSDGNPLMVGMKYYWMGEDISVEQFDDAVVYFSNGIQMHVTEYIDSVLGTEEENYEDAAGFPSKA